MNSQKSQQMRLSNTLCDSNGYRFIKKFLGAPSDSDVESLRTENEKLKEQVASLETKVQELEKEVHQLNLNYIA